MDQKRQNYLIFLFLFAVVFPPGQLSAEIHYLEVIKCCVKGEYMNTERYCISRPKTRVELIKNETFSPPMDPEKVYWLPYSLRSRHIHARYATYTGKGRYIDIDKNESIVEKFISINNTARNFFLDIFGPTVIEITVLKQLYCFEATDDPLNPFVVRTRVAPNFLAKCCKKGEEFNSGFNCVTKSGFTSENVSAEYYLGRQENESYWLPEVINESVHAFYNVGAKVSWNTRTLANNLTTWKLVEDDFGYKVKFTHPPVPIGTEINTVARSYCIDSTNNPNMSHVVVGLVINANKCCKLGEKIDYKDRKCVLRDGYNIENTPFGVETPTTSYWLPSRLGNKSIPVFYNYFESSQLGIHSRHMFRAEENNWVIKAGPDEEPRLSLVVRSLSGRTRFVPANEYCFDAIEDSPFAPIVLITFANCYEVKCLPKCCPRYQVLTKSGRCENHPSASWHPLNSSISSFLDPDESYGVRLQPTPFCDGHYKVTEFEPKQAAELLSTVPDREASLSTLSRTFHCADFLQVGDELQETVASCEWPPSGRTYAVVRHLSIISVVLFLNAIAALLTQEHIRNSTHGQAMASHAFSLLATNTLTSAFMYNGATLEHCLIFTFPIYFFLLAAGFWLNVVSINITLGFREPPGQKITPHGRRERIVKLALTHAYGWGMPAVLTAFTITMFYSTNAAWVKNLYKPSFAETRTCFYEITCNSDVGYYEYNSDLEIASLMYYYGPMAVLVIINSICLVLTLLRIRSLSKDSAFLQNASAGGTNKKAASQILANTLLYVKLLLFTGVMELIVEAVIWGTRKRRFEILHLVSYYALEVAFIYRISAVILDLIRACSVCWLSVGRIHRGWIQTLRRGGLCLRKSNLKPRILNAHGSWSREHSSTRVTDVPGISLQLNDEVMGVSLEDVSK